MARGKVGLPVDWEVIEQKRKENKLSKKELGILLGYGSTYINNSIRQNTALSKDTIEKLADLFDMNPREFMPRPKTEKPVKVATDKTIDVLIAEIGKLTNRIEQLERKIEQPVICEIPMEAKEMARRIVERLLEGGWCSADDVLVEFNKHHIPGVYINDAVRANGAIAATAGVADRARTFYIKEV